MQVIPPLLSRATPDHSGQPSTAPVYIPLFNGGSPPTKKYPRPFTPHNRLSRACFRPTLTPNHFPRTAMHHGVRCWRQRRRGGPAGGGRHRQAAGCGRCPCGLARPSWAARATNSRLLWYLPPPGGVLDPAGMGQAVDGLVQHGLEGLAGPSARRSPETNSSGLRRAADRSRAAAPWPSSVGRPSTQWSAPRWPHLASMWKALEDRPVPVTTTTSGRSGVRRRMSARVYSRAAMRPSQSS
jgi:hypothetical protein